jgi:hypothetical protein
MNLGNYVAAAVMTCSVTASAVAAEPTMWHISRGGSSTALIQGLLRPVAMALSADCSEPVVGSWGDGSVRRYRLGDLR